jgi:hypothetical protein
VERRIYDKLRHGANGCKLLIVSLLAFQEIDCTLEIQLSRGGGCLGGAHGRRGDDGRCRANGGAH